MDAIAPQIISRAEAKALGLKRYFTGNPCPRNHISERTVSNKACCECANLFSAEYKLANLETVRSKAVAYYWKNPEKSRARRRKYGKENRQAEAARSREWFLANPEKVREYQRRDFEKNREKKSAFAKEWRKRNVAKQRFYSNRRRAMEYAAVPVVPPDLEPIMRAEVLAIYAEARTTQELTGIRHDVDHIFPIMKGGVHAPWNLRVILRSENQSKKDKWPSDEPLMVMWHGMLVSRVKEME